MSYYEQFPIGADGPSFTWTDLLTTIRQDAWSGQVYFTGKDDDILCVNSVLNPAVQWCAPKATPTDGPVWGSVVWNPPPPPVHHAVTPEPGMGMMLLIVVILFILFRTFTEDGRKND